MKYLAEFMTTRQILLAVFLFSLVVTYVFLLLPMVRVLDSQLKQVRGLLMIVPPSVAEKIPSLRELLMPQARMRL